MYAGQGTASLNNVGALIQARKSCPLPTFKLILNQMALLWPVSNSVWMGMPPPNLKTILCLYLGVDNMGWGYRLQNPSRSPTPKPTLLHEPGLGFHLPFSGTISFPGWVVKPSREAYWDCPSTGHCHLIDTTFPPD